MKIRSLALATMLLSGCSSIMTPSSEKQYDASIASGDFTSAAQVAVQSAGYNPEKQSIKNLLWALEAGASLNYAGDHELSNKIFDATEESMKDVDTKNVATKTLQTGASFLINDTIIPYKQTQYDSVMANTYKAWNFMHLGDYNNARVEWNRAEERQRRAVEYFNKQIQEQQEEIAKERENAPEATDEYVNKTLENEETQQRLAEQGVTFDKWQPYEGYVNPFTTYSNALNLLLNGKSRADFSKSANLFKRVYGLTNSPQAKQNMGLAQRLRSNKNAADKMVWVIYERGESMAKDEFRIDLPLFVFTDQIAYTGIALPKLVERSDAFPHIEVEGVKTELLADMDKIIGAEFEKTYPAVLTKEILRALLKTAVQHKASEKSKEHGYAFGLLQAITTQADTRSFKALPKQYQTAQFKRTGETVNIKAGEHTVQVNIDTNADHHIVLVKATNSHSAPMVRVINI